MADSSDSFSMYRAVVAVLQLDDLTWMHAVGLTASDHVSNRGCRGRGRCLISSGEILAKQLHRQVHGAVLPK